MGVPRSARAKSVAASVGAATGGLCLLWFLTSAFFGLKLVVLTTGSMEPGMPAGTGAVTVPVDASAIRVGDVLTVDRGEDALPVTHRVIAVESDPTDSAARVVRMQGDANAHEDPKPYRLRESDRVVVALPYLGTAAVLARSPLGLASGTLAVAALVVWVFWPSPSRVAAEPGGVPR